jgi:hypothetical protein
MNHSDLDERKMAGSQNEQLKYYNIIHLGKANKHLGPTSSLLGRGDTVQVREY